MSVSTLSAGWQPVFQLQHHLENNKLSDSRSWAAEEALDDVLGLFGDGDDVADADTGRLIHSRRLNRRRRNWKREALLTEHEKSVRAELSRRVSDVSAAAERVDLLHHLEQKLDAPDFTVLKLLAYGQSYKELSVKLGVSEASLRTQVCRAREKARSLVM